MSLRDYGDLTPQELMLYVDDYNAKRQKQQEDMLTQAYLTAYWQRVEKMPSLRKVLEDAKPRKIEPQTPEQMFENIKRLHAQLSREEG